MKFFMIVNDSNVAKYAHDSGVDFLFVDLEYMGKDERQKNLDSWKSRQTIADLTRIRKTVPEGSIMVRINPMHSDTKAELDAVINEGANTVMLPMFRTTSELAKFFDLLDGRVNALPLFETVGSIISMPEILESLPVEQLHIGLNDLHLDAKLAFMFEPIANGMLEDVSKLLCENDIEFGLGGVARANEGLIPPNYLFGEHVRLGSSRAILSRTFHRKAETLQELKKSLNLPEELKALRDIYNGFLNKTPEELEENRKITARKIFNICDTIRDAAKINYAN